MRQQRFYKILNKYIRGGYSTVGEHLVQYWLVVQERTKKLDDILVQLWRQPDTDFNKEIMDTTLQSIHEHIREEQLQNKSKKLRISIFRWAAILVLPLFSGLICWQIATRQATQRNEFQRLFVKNGQCATIKLSDGSTIKLNGGSQVWYPKEFQKSCPRQIWLEGEAYFNIAHDAKRPFHVNTGMVDIQVLGTVFNVKAYREEANITTTLLKGSVAISYKGKVLRLRSCEQAILNCKSDEITIGKIPSTMAAPWVKGNLVFRKAQLQDILSALSHKYGVKFHTEADVNLNTRYSANFIATENIDSILSVLTAMSENLTFSRQSKTIYINNQKERR